MIDAAPKLGINKRVSSFRVRNPGKNDEGKFLDNIQIFLPCLLVPLPFLLFFFKHFTKLTREEKSSEAKLYGVGVGNVS